MNRPNRPLAALAGYFSDLEKLARGVPINPHSVLKFRVLKELARRTGARTLIETGTYLGVTAARCARVYDQVVTIELDPDLAAKAAVHLCRFPNVRVIQGDATKHLGQILAASPEGSVVAFLDGHFSGGMTARGELPEPAIVELGLLAAYVSRVQAIVIDDFRLFGVEPGFPSKAALVEAAEAQFAAGDFDLAVCFDQLILERRRSR
jgi:hypothetical protein